MKGHWGKLLIVLFIASAAVAAALLLPPGLLDIHQIQHHREQLFSYIALHRFEAVVCFISLYIASALFLPGALALTIAGGMFFGAVQTMVYANLGATLGATLAFIAARYLIGHWVQERFHQQLVRFNKEMAQHGPHYLVTLRLLPVAPFFVINYCAGITKIPLKTFVWSTSLGTIPGSAVYGFLGEQLRFVNRVEDLLSWKVVLSLSLLGLLSLFPVILHHLQPQSKQ